MKKFLNIFIFIQVILLIYIFNTSIMNIYEKNNIINNDLKGYQINSDELIDSENFFDDLTDKLDNYQLVLIKNTVSTTNNSAYDIYILPYESYKQKNTFSKNITYTYKPLKKADWIDSTGKFYTNAPKTDIEKIATENNLVLTEKNIDSIDYRQAIKLFSYNFIVLFIITQIVYCIYVSYNLKEIGIKLSMGFSKFKIFIDYLKYLGKKFILFISLVIIPYGLYLAISNRLTLQYILLITIYFVLVIAINLLLFYNGSFIISLVDLDLMIKNKTFNRQNNIFIQTIKIISIILFVFSFATLISEYANYKEVNADILRYKELDNFYTGNGYYSDEYDLIEVEEDKKIEYASNMKSLYIKEDGLFCDISYLSDYLKGRGGEENNFAIINKRYLTKFSNLPEFISDLNSLPGNTVLISKDIKSSQEIILDFLNEVVKLNLNYMTGSEFEVSKFNIIYVPEIKVKVNTDKGFQEINIPVIYVDQGGLNGLYYLDQFSNSNIIFEFNSREEYIEKLNFYNLDKLIGAGTLLTPYLTYIESVIFKLKTLSVFSILFAITLAFIIYISNFISIDVNKKKYVYKEILGYSHFMILKFNYLITSLLFLIGIFVSLFDIKLVTLIIIILMDAIVFELLYKNNIDNKLYEIVKGA